jgi:hypothetical protein
LRHSLHCPWARCWCIIEFSTAATANRLFLACTSTYSYPSCAYTKSGSSNTYALGFSWIASFIFIYLSTWTIAISLA